MSYTKFSSMLIADIGTKLNNLGDNPTPQMFQSMIDEILANWYEQTKECDELTQEVIDTNILQPVMAKLFGQPENI